MLLVLIKLYNLSLIWSKVSSSAVFYFHAQCNDYLLKRVTGISPLEVRWNWYSFVIHLPVKGSTHSIPCLCFIPKVIVVNDIDHGTYNSFMVQCNLVWNMETENMKSARQSSHLSTYQKKKSHWKPFLPLLLLYCFLIGRLFRQVPMALEAFQFSYLHPALDLSGLGALSQWLEAIIVLQTEKHPRGTIKVKPCISLSLQCSVLSLICHIRSQQECSERKKMVIWGLHTRFTKKMLLLVIEIYLVLL